MLFGQVIKNWFWDSYDNLGRLILYNLLWFVISLPFYAVYAVLIFIFGPVVLQLFNTENSFIFLAYVLFLPVFITVLINSSPATAALFYMTGQMVAQKSSEFKEFFIALKKYFLKSFLLALILAGVTLVLFIDFLFFSSEFLEINWVRFLGVGISFWMIVFWALMQVYLLPFFVSRNESVLQTLKYAALLVLVNPLRTFFTLIFLMIIIVVSLISAAGVVFLMMGLTSIMQHNLFVEVIRKHGGGDMEGEDRHAYRGWRDIIKPWE